MQLVVVYNPRSGGAFTKDSLSTQFKKNGLRPEAWILIENLQKKLPRYLKRNITVAVIGGDGTISAAASLVSGSPAVLAPLPGGTLNHFTKDLGISQDIETAIAHLKNAEVHTLDVAEVNGITFVNNSSIGLYPTSLRTRDALERKFGKWPSAVYAALRAMIRLRLFTVTIEKETFRTPFVFVGNNKYTIDEMGAPSRKKLDTGTLSVFVAKTGSRVFLLKIALFAFIGRAKYLDEFDSYTPKELTIKMKRHHVHVSYDGEVTKLKAPLHYTVRKKSLRTLY